MIVVSICLCILLSACSGKIPNQEFFIQQAKLSESEKNIVQLVKGEKQDAIFDFKVDNKVKGLQVHIYKLKDSQWELVQEGSVPMSNSNGRIAVLCEKMSSGFDIAVQEEQGIERITWQGEKQENHDNMGYYRSTLSERTAIEYEQEIPVFIQIMTSKKEVNSYIVDSFFEPERFAKEGYEGVYAVTVSFLSQSLDA